MFRREWRQQTPGGERCSRSPSRPPSAASRSPRTPFPPTTATSARPTSCSRSTAPIRARLEAGLDAARKSFGTIEVIGHRSVRRPGDVETVDYRSQAPGGPYGGELLALRRGSYPDGPGEVAVTNGVAGVSSARIGSSLALDGRRRTVVGIVENPRKLSDEFALVSPSSASAGPGRRARRRGGRRGSSESFFQSQGDRADSAFAGSMNRGSDVSSAAETLAIFSVATVFLLLASLVAAAGFAVVAQRRLRQLGMLAAIGATQKHLRLVLLANGAVVGAIAAVVGTIAGLALWVVFAPTLESAVDHRIDRLSLPWGLITMAVVLSVVGAASPPGGPGERSPAFPSCSRSRGDRPAEARTPFGDRGRGLIAVGIVCLALSGRDRAPLIIAGLMTTIVGSLLLGPLAIRTFSREPRESRSRLDSHSETWLATRPVPERRSPPVTLALGIAAAVVVTASAEEAKAAAEPPTLSDRQIRVYLGPPDARQFTPVDAPAQLGRLAASVRQLAGQLDRATVIPLIKAIATGPTPPSSSADTRVIPASSSQDDSTAQPAAGVPRPIAASCRHTRGAQVPRNRPRRGGAEHRLPRRPERRGRGARHPELHEPATRSPSRTSRRSRPESTSSAPPARHRTSSSRRRPSSPRLEADPRRLARRVEPASDPPADRRRPRHRVESRSHDRGPEGTVDPKRRPRASQQPRAPCSHSPSSP